MTTTTAELQLNTTRNNPPPLPSPNPNAVSPRASCREQMQDAYFRFPGAQRQTKETICRCKKCKKCNYAPEHTDVGSFAATGKHHAISYNGPTVRQKMLKLCDD